MMWGERFELFAVLTGNALKSIQRLKMYKMKEYGLSSAHTNCICRLENAGDAGLTQVELVQQEMMDASQVSRVLRELTEKQYVKIDGETGKYRRRYKLTDKGRMVAEEIRKVIGEINRYVSESIPAGDMEAFYRTLCRISENLGRAEQLYIGSEK